jgi:peptidoglycan LD-endopeptidase CwlK
MFFKFLNWVVFLFKKKSQPIVVNNMLVPAIDPDDQLKIIQLYPPLQSKFTNFLIQARAHGFEVSIFESLRTMDRQQELYQQGRNESGQVIDRSKIVTDAPAGMTFHNYGLACDLVFFTLSSDKNKLWSWDSKLPYEKLADLGRSLGFDSGYFWSKLIDPPHFEMNYGFKEHELLAIYQKSKLQGVWQAIDQRKKV